MLWNDYSVKFIVLILSEVPGLVVRQPDCHLPLQLCPTQFLDFSSFERGTFIQMCVIKLSAKIGDDVLMLVGA